MGNNIFISALRAAVKSLLSCKQPKTGVYNDFQSVSFSCSVVSVSCHEDLSKDGSMLQEGGVQSDYPAQDAGQQIKIPSIFPVPCSELTLTEVKRWNAIAPSPVNTEPLVGLGALCAIPADTWKGINDGKQ